MHTANDYGAKGMWPEALHYYERLWVEFPQSSQVDEAKLQAARIYAGPEAKPRSADDLYRDLTLNAGDREMRETALHELADIYKAKPATTGRAIELLSLHLRRFTNYPGRAKIVLELAQLYLDAGRFSEAIDTANRLDTDRDLEIRNSALVIIAQALENTHFESDALKHYQRVADSSRIGSPLWIAAMEGRGRCLEASGSWLDALKVIRELRDNHTNPDAIERWLVAVQHRHSEMKR